MATGFSPFSVSPTSSDDSAVENAITEIIELAALDQIKSLPKPYRSSSSLCVLPPQLDTRFQKLKSSTSLPNSLAHTMSEAPVPPPASEKSAAENQSSTIPEKRTLEKVPSRHVTSGTEEEEEEGVEMGRSNSSSDSAGRIKSGGGCCFWVSRSGRKERKELEKMNREIARSIKWADEEFQRIGIDDLELDCEKKSYKGTKK